MNCTRQIGLALEHLIGAVCGITLFCSAVCFVVSTEARADICQPRIISGSRDNTIKVWVMSSPSPLITLSGHSNIVFSIASSPDAKRFASGSADLTIKVWDAETFGLITTIPAAHDNFVRSLAWSPDGSKIVSGSDDRTAKIWDATTYQLLGTPLTGHVGAVNSVAWSSDSRKIASGSDDRTAKIWD